MATCSLPCAGKVPAVLPFGMENQPSQDTEGCPLGPFTPEPDETISYTQTRRPRKPPCQESPLSNPSSYFALRTSTDHPPPFLTQLWVTERLPMASSREHGKDLPSVQLLMKKNQVRQRLTAKKKIPRSSLDAEFCFFLRPGVSLAPLHAVWDPRLQWVWPFLTRGGRLPLVADHRDQRGFTITPPGQKGGEVKGIREGRETSVRGLNLSRCKGTRQVGRSLANLTVFPFMLLGTDPAKGDPGP